MKHTTKQTQGNLEIINTNNKKSTRHHRIGQTPYRSAAISSSGRFSSAASSVHRLYAFCHQLRPPSFMRGTAAPDVGGGGGLWSGCSGGSPMPPSFQYGFSSRLLRTSSNASASACRASALAFLFRLASAANEKMSATSSVIQLSRWQTSTHQTEMHTK